MNPQTISNRAVLTFGDSGGGKASFSISRARLGKTAEEARESMQAIIDSGALELMIGPIAVAKGAKLVHTTRTQIA